MILEEFGCVIISDVAHEAIGHVNVLPAIIVKIGNQIGPTPVGIGDTCQLRNVAEG